VQLATVQASVTVGLESIIITISSPAGPVHKQPGRACCVKVTVGLGSIIILYIRLFATQAEQEQIREKQNRKEKMNDNACN
jgi:hypothetical protein